MSTQDKSTIRDLCRRAIDEGADLKSLIKTYEDLNRKALRGSEAESPGTQRGVAMRKLAVKIWKEALA